MNLWNLLKSSFANLARLGYYKYNFETIRRIAEPSARSAVVSFFFSPRAASRIASFAVFNCWLMHRRQFELSHLYPNTRAFWGCSKASSSSILLIILGWCAAKNKVDSWCIHKSFACRSDPPIFSDTSQVEHTSEIRSATMAGPHVLHVAGWGTCKSTSCFDIPVWCLRRLLLQ